MPDLDELMKAIPVQDIAEQLGVPATVAEAAVEQVLPGLVGGMAVNAQSDTGAKSLEKALSQHAGKKIGPRTSLREVDSADGEKIVSHVFGAKKDDVASALASTSSASDVTGDLIKQILPIVAPIVLAWLANQFLGQKSEPAATESASSGGIGDLLGGLLGSKQGQDMIGGVLGGLLGSK